MTSTSDLPPIFVTGAGGMLGRSLQERLRGHPGLAAPTHGEVDVCDADGLRRAMQTWLEAGLDGPRSRSDEGAGEGSGRELSATPVVLHCAAWTDVDGAESAPEAAARVNVDGTRNVVAAADALGARVIHISTDYVLDAPAGRPIPIDAPRSPLGVYGRTKARAEEIVEASPGGHLIVRTSWLFGPAGRNFADTMLGLADRDRITVVSDQRGAPTWTPDLADALVVLAAAGASGILHLANAGSTTWAAYAERIFARLGRGPEVIPVTTEEYGAPAPRPRWSVLDLAPAESLLGRPMRPWTEALDDHLRARGVSLAGSRIDPPHLARDA